MDRIRFDIKQYADRCKDKGMLDVVYYFFRSFEDKTDKTREEQEARETFYKAFYGDQD